MIVADANITAYLLIESDYSQLARELYKLDPHWIVPQIWPHEFMNLLATYAKTGGLSETESCATWQDALQLIAGRIMPTDFDAVFNLAVRHHLSVYDAEYVDLAQKREIPLITEDKRLIKSFPNHAFSLERYLTGNS